MSNTQQAFQRYDLVHISANLPAHSAHFPCDCDAIILGSYADLYGGSDRNSYSVYIKGSGENAWYCACHLTLVEHHRLDLLAEWEVEVETERFQKSSLER